MASPLNRIASWLTRSLGATAGGAGVGAGVGAIADPEDPLRGAEIGAVTGAVGGPSALAVERLLSRGAFPAAKFLMSNSLAPSSVRRRALDEVRDVMELDELSPADLRGRLDSYLGQPVTLADVGGENMLSRADAASKVPGPARNAAKAALANRMDDQPARIMDMVRRHLTPSSDARLAIKDLQEIKRREADKMYGDVYAAHPVVEDKNVYALMPRLDAAGALGNAEQLAGITGLNLPKPTDLALPDGSTKKVYQNLSAAQLDQVKRGLDDAIGVAKRAGESEKLRALVMLKQEYLGELDTLMPGYADARARFAGYSSSQQAVEEGRRFDTGQPEDTLAYFSSLDPGDQDFFRIGVGQRIKDLIASGAEGQDSVKRFFKKRGSREKLETIFPDPASYEAFREGLEQELNMAATSGKIRGGSPTQPRQLEERARLGADPVAYAALTPGGVGTRALNLALSLVGHDQDKLNQLTAGEVTKLLLNPNLHLNRQALEALAGRQRDQRIKQIISGGLQAAATAGGAGGAAAFTAQPRRAATDEDQAPPDMAKGGSVRDAAELADRLRRDPLAWPYDGSGEPERPEVVRLDEPGSSGPARYGNPRTFRSVTADASDELLPYTDEMDAWLGTLGEVGLPTARELPVGRGPRQQGGDPEYNDRFDAAYADRLALERAAREDWEGRHPYSALAAGLGGGAAMSLAGGAMFVPGEVLALGSRLLPGLGRAAARRGALGWLAREAVPNATLMVPGSAFYGADTGGGSDLDERLAGAAIGAASSLPFLGLGPAATGARKVGRRALSHLRAILDTGD
jgi:hypothetical protein